MSEPEFRVIAEQVAKHTKYVYYHVMGEPLTHPQLSELIRIASGLGLKSAITTNGTLLAERGDELIAAGVYKVNISVHSYENEKEYKDYISSCLDFADKASKCGVLVVLRLWNGGHDGGHNDEIVEMMRERFADGEWVSGKRGVRIRHKLHLEHGDRFEWPDMQAKEGSERVFCYGLDDHFAILCDGTVVPCCLDAEGTLALGNALEGELSDILASERAERIRNGFRNHVACEELCRRCGYARRFLGE